MMFHNHKSQQGNPPIPRKPPGQALVEYVLILALVVIGLVAILAITGPAIGNIFSNTVFNLLGAEPLRETLSPDEFWATITQVWLITPGVTPFETWTPAPATFTPTTAPSRTPTPTVPTATSSVTPSPGPSPTPTEAVFAIPWDDNVEAPNSRDFFVPDEASNCGWAVTSEHFHSAAHAWSDSPNGFYVHGSNCSLVLRGVLDLTGAIAPQLTFWDSWNLRAYDSAYVEVSTDGGASWINLTTADNGALHYNSTNLNFTYEAVDLSGFVDQQIRLRFRLDATSNLAVGDGWYIDDIAIGEADLNTYTMPFIDDVEGGGSCPVSEDCWIAGGTWAVSGEETHTGGGAWSDSPGSNYVHGTNSSLTLNGVIDLATATHPELTFWNRWHLRPYDHAYVEIAAEGEGWSVVLDHYNNANLAWTREAIDLGPYIGDRIRIRFRLDATNHSAVGDGWWIDDIEVSESTTPTITLPWSDDMEAGSLWWIPEGTWALSAEQRHSGSAAWSDSPGQNYVHGSNASLILDAIVDLRGTTNPELVFWDRYNLRAYDSAYVEISQDGGGTWSPLLQHYNSTDLGWSRNIIDLTPYAGLSDVHFRFRLDARSHSQVGDGWWIDDVVLREHTDTIITLPWCDDFEAGTTEWCDDTRDFLDHWSPGGTWALGADGPSTTGACHSGFNCWSDSPGANYVHRSNATLELDAKIDLTGTSDPILFYWEAYNVRAYDHAIVEVSTDGGITWVEADPAHFTDDHYYTTNLAWTRNQISLASFTGQQVNIRFRLDARDSPETGDGWWIDDIKVVDYSPRVYSLPFLDEAEPGYLPNWIVEGTWGLNNDNVCPDPLCQPSDWVYDDSPAGDYLHNTAFSMILDGVVDLSGSANPGLTIWAIYDLDRYDYARVEVSEDGGYTWVPCVTLAGPGSNLTWRQYAADLTSFVSSGQVGLRLRLDARIDWRTDPGVHFDRIEIAD